MTAMLKCTIAMLVFLLLVAGSAFAAPDEALLFEPGEIVLKLNEGYVIEDIAGEFGLLVRQFLPQLDIYHCDVVGSSDLLALSAQIEARDEVVFCHPNYLIDPLRSVQGSFPFGDLEGTGKYTDQASALQLNLPTVHQLSTGQGVTVAVLDGGINYNHPALVGAVTSGFDYVDNDTDAFDEPGGVNSGHGTFVAGVIHLVAPDRSRCQQRPAACSPSDPS